MGSVPSCCKKPVSDLSPLPVSICASGYTHSETLQQKHAKLYQARNINNLG